MDHETLVYLEPRFQDQFPPPPDGQVRLVVARHEMGERYEDAIEYHEQRKRLLHTLADDAVVVDWGSTDEDGVRETETLFLLWAAVVVPALAQVMAAWITSRPRKAKGGEAAEASVAGMLFTRPDGSNLLVSGQDGLTPEQRRDHIQDFLGAGQPAAPRPGPATPGPE